MSDEHIHNSQNDLPNEPIQDEDQSNPGEVLIAIQEWRLLLYLVNNAKNGFIATDQIMEDLKMSKYLFNDVMDTLQIRLQKLGLPSSELLFPDENSYIFPDKNKWSINNSTLTITFGINRNNREKSYTLTIPLAHKPAVVNLLTVLSELTNQRVATKTIAKKLTRYGKPDDQNVPGAGVAIEPVAKRIESLLEEMLEVIDQKYPVKKDDFESQMTNMLLKGAAKMLFARDIVHGWHVENFGERLNFTPTTEHLRGIVTYRSGEHSRTIEIEPASYKLLMTIIGFYQESPAEFLTIEELQRRSGLSKKELPSRLYRLRTSLYDLNLDRDQLLVLSIVYDINFPELSRMVVENDMRFKCEVVLGDQRVLIEGENNVELTKYLLSLRRTRSPSKSRLLAVSKLRESMPDLDAKFPRNINYLRERLLPLLSSPADDFLAKKKGYLTDPFLLFQLSISDQPTKYAGTLSLISKDKPSQD